MPFRRVVIPLLVGASLVYASTLAAQSVGGSLQGFVTDASGAALPRAQVLILNIGTGATRELTTDEGGRYRAPILPPGNYEVHVTAGGFQTAVRRGIRLDIGQTLDVDPPRGGGGGGATGGVT